MICAKSFLSPIVPFSVLITGPLSPLTSIVCALVASLRETSSRRFWRASSYQERLAAGADQVMLDKENVRQWLIREKGFSGHGPLPVIPEEVRIKTAELYLGTFEEITGTPLKAVAGDVEARIQKNLQRHGYL